MPNLYASKRPHELHYSANADDFRRRFERHLGQGLTEFISNHVPGTNKGVALLTGSISDGIGNEVSDADLMVILDTDGPVELAPCRFGEASASVKTAGAGALELAVIDGVIGGVETDIAVISGRRLGELCAALDRGGTSLQEDEIRTLTRIKRGWVLADETGYLATFDSLMRGIGLEIYCSTTYYSLALKRLEDAFPAAETNADLSAHLGRLGIEHGFHAYLAGLGYCYPSAKWLSLLDRYGGEPILDRGVDLLFPPRMTHADDLRRYLTDAQAFVGDIRALIERDRTLRIAFEYCPQIYRPAFALAAS